MRKRFTTGRQGKGWAVRDNVLGRIVADGFKTRREAAHDAWLREVKDKEGR